MRYQSASPVVMLPNSRFQAGVEAGELPGGQHIQETLGAGVVPHVRAAPLRAFMVPLQGHGDPVGAGVPVAGRHRDVARAAPGNHHVGTVLGAVGHALVEGVFRNLQLAVELVVLLLVRRRHRRVPVLSISGDAQRVPLAVLGLDQNPVHVAAGFNGPHHRLNRRPGGELGGCRGAGGIVVGARALLLGGGSGRRFGVRPA